MKDKTNKSPTSGEAKVFVEEQAVTAPEAEVTESPAQGAAATDADTVALLDEALTQVAQARAEVAEARADIARVKQENDELREQMEELRLKPGSATVPTRSGYYVIPLKVCPKPMRTLARGERLVVTVAGRLTADGLLIEETKLL